MLYDLIDLIRLNRPTGFYLLFLPCTWSLALSDAPFHYWVIFFFGALFARSAGCVYNDFVDRKKDKLVERTMHRPLPSGRISGRVSLIIASFFSIAGLFTLLLLPDMSVAIALISIPMVLAYPFMKRFTWLPQLWLALTFNWGVFVAGGFNLVTGFMYLGGVFWTMAYDTIYGFQDYEHDGEAGIKSLSRLAGYEKGLLIVRRFYMLAVLCWFIAGTFWFHNPIPYYLFCLLALSLALFQMKKLDLRDPVQCSKKFSLEPIFGALITLGIFSSEMLT